MKREAMAVCPSLYKAMEPCDCPCVEQSAWTLVEFIIAFV